MHELLVPTYLLNLVNDPDPTYQQMINYVLSFKNNFFLSKRLNTIIVIHYKQHIHQNHNFNLCLKFKLKCIMTLLMSNYSNCVY